MRKILFALLGLALTAPAAWADSTIDLLAVGGALGGAERLPMFQSSNPAVTTTPTAIGAYIVGLTLPAASPSMIGLTLTGLGGTGTRCLHVNASNVISAAAGDCGVGGSGSVTSVAMTVPPSIFTIGGSPITTSGTLAIGLATQTANNVWAGPTGGAAAAPGFRTLVTSDLPLQGVTNAVLNVGPANTLKANFTGSNVEQDASAPSCSGPGQAWNYTTNVGIGCITTAAGAINLNPGLASTPTTYNPGGVGGQTVTGGGTISNQLWPVKITANCTINVNCSSGVPGGPFTNDSGLLITATATGLTITVPAAGALGTAGYSFGYDGAHSYTLTTSGGSTFYGNCGASAATLSGLANPAVITTDGTNWQCTLFGGGGGGSLSGMTPGQIPIAASATAVTSSVFLGGYLNGLLLSNDSGTPNTVIDVANGIAADDTNVLYINLTANFTKSIPGTIFAAGSGNSCQDVAGTPVVSTWYFVFLISNVTGSTVDILCSQSFGSPALPTGYTLKRWIGNFATDASSHIRAFQTLDGHHYTWKVATVTNSTATTAQTLVTLDVPISINVAPLCRVAMSNAAAATVLITDPYVTDAAPGATGTVPWTTAPGWDLNQISTSAAGDINADCPLGLRTNTSGQVATHASLTSTTLNFINKGWDQ